jgi:hypothetical protein
VDTFSKKDPDPVWDRILIWTGSGSGLSLKVGSGPNPAGSPTLDERKGKEEINSKLKYGAG